MVRRYGTPLMAVLVAVCAGSAYAQNVSHPSSDWNGSWSFSSSGDKTLRILQADIIEKKETGYYESLGKNDFTINYDHRQGSFDNINASDGATIDVSTHVGDAIGQNTNVIGAINNSNTTIDVEGHGINVTATNEALSEGCLDGGITSWSAEAPSSYGTGGLCD